MKKSKLSKDDISKLCKELKYFFNKHLLVHFKNNSLLYYFIVTSLINTVLLRILTVGNFLYLKPLFADLAMLFILASFMFMFRTSKKRKKYLLVLSFITTIMCIIHSVYYTYYSSFVSVSFGCAETLPRSMSPFNTVTETPVSLCTRFK